MKELFYFTFTERSAFDGCLQPVWANHEKNAINIIMAGYGSDWDRLYNAQEGRVIKDNQGLVLLDALGVE